MMSKYPRTVTIYPGILVVAENQDDYDRIIKSDLMTIKATACACISIVIVIAVFVVRVSL